MVPSAGAACPASPEDLDKTDARRHGVHRCHNRRYQDRDNYVWVRDAKKNKLVVGTQCRILYQDAVGRMNIALKFNEMVRNGEIGPVMLGRDHHDTGGTDSPFRETSNIKDGSNIMADMAIQCYAGNCARGMSLVRPAQRRRRRHRQGHQRRLRHGAGRLASGWTPSCAWPCPGIPWWACPAAPGPGNENALSRRRACITNNLHESHDHITVPYTAADDGDDR